MIKLKIDEYICVGISDYDKFIRDVETTAAFVGKLLDDYKGTSLSLYSSVSAVKEDWCSYVDAIKKSALSEKNAAIKMVYPPAFNPVSKLPKCTRQTTSKLNPVLDPKVEPILFGSYTARVRSKALKAGKNTPHSERHVFVPVDIKCDEISEPDSGEENAIDDIIEDLASGKIDGMDDDRADEKTEAANADEDDCYFDEKDVDWNWPDRIPPGETRLVTSSTRRVSVIYSTVDGDSFESAAANITSRHPDCAATVSPTSIREHSIAINPAVAMPKKKRRRKNKLRRVADDSKIQFKEMTYLVVVLPPAS